MSWTRRRFVTGLSLGAVAAACESASSDDKAGPAPAPPPAKTAPAGGPAKPPSRPPSKPPVNRGYPLRRPYDLQFRDGATYDGDELLLIKNSVVVRLDHKLVEKTRLPVKDVRSFALLPDRSLVVMTNDAVVHVVDDKVVGSQPSWGLQVRSAGSSTEFWSLSMTGSAVRVKLGATKLTPTTSLPENTHDASAESLADGTLVIGHNNGILRVDQTATLYTWSEPADIVSRGPDPMTVWVNVNHEKLVLVKLEKDRVVAKASHALAKGDQFVHSTSNGPLAGGIVAHAVTPSQATFSLVVWDAKKERFRVALDDAPYVSRLAVMSDKRIAALADAPGTSVAFDLATGRRV